MSRIYTSASSDAHLSVAQTEAISRTQYIDYLRLHNEVGWDVDDVGAVDEAVSEGGSSQTPLLASMDPHYRIWLNVDDAEDLAEPSTLRAELRQLRAIEDEWRQRRTAEIKAKAQHLSQWRTELADETWEADKDESIAVDSVAGDDCLAPEDAVDETPLPRQGRWNQGENGNEPLRSGCDNDALAPDAVDRPMFAREEQNQLEAVPSPRDSVINGSTKAAF